MFLWYTRIGEDMINYRNTENGFLSKILLREFPALSYSELKVIFRKKDIKIDGKRINSDIRLNGGEEIIVYNKDKEIKVIYEDDNIFFTALLHLSLITLQQLCTHSNENPDFGQWIHSTFPARSTQHFRLLPLPL